MVWAQVGHKQTSHENTKAQVKQQLPWLSKGQTLWQLKHILGNLLAYYRHKAAAPPRALQFLISFPPSAQLLGQMCVYLCDKGASFYKMLETWRSERLTQVPVHPGGLQLIPVFAHISIFPFWLPGLLMLGPPPAAETTAVGKPYKQKEGTFKRMT